MIEKPMNPFAEEDFRNAMKQKSKDVGKRFRDFSEDLKKIGEQMQADFPFIDFADMGEEYSGVMRLKADADKDISNILNALLYNGYEVTMRVEDATETEKELDGVDKFVVIEYGKVE